MRMNVIVKYVVAHCIVKSSLTLKTVFPLASVKVMGPVAVTLTGTGEVAGRVALNCCSAFSKAWIGQGGVEKVKGWSTTGIVVVQLAPQSAQVNFHEINLSTFKSTENLDPVSRS